MTELHQLASAGWICLTFLCMVVTMIPALESMSEHGKLLSGSGGTAIWWQRLSVPKRLFAHFYVAGFVFVTMVVAWHSPQARACLLPTQHSPASMNTGTCRLKSDVLVVALLFQAHLARRVCECLYVHRWGRARMHAAAYAVGIAHYALAAFTLAVELPAGADSKQVTSHKDTPVGIIIAQLAGVLLFLAANAGQNAAHRHLASLKPDTRAGTDTASYRIPTAGLFSEVSCPHYFWEIALYASFVMITGGQVCSVVLMLVWVITNLSINAAHMHAWYWSHLKDYPVRRRRLVPFLW
ncbi:3-oxo-5-alpha-steroid 4-dehydrogenase-domain-containing protein [Tribonema minus]|uniref:3-oxo-5-alpha-steroid 4-dehydrogenase-domain-containing protein n=1 Tax=Tribonema minus TaxID=303371 RepID=A0A835Z372_9STRA|nr:3-oxo-5-alpha-steroid 4-dehydrogenase-domain-containing protein [Tribonema minus]